ncbi:MAG: tRNA preQ1(34) S-adenosylmethionine ribosyltransferase-isomerase QueA [Planctomycetota bacterium]
MKVDDFSYSLPKEFIAKEPARPRDASRLLVLDRRTGRREHRTFRDLPEYLRPGDVLVLNDTRVVPARLIARRRTGGRVKALLVERIDANRWDALLDTSRSLRVGESLRFSAKVWAKIAGKEGDGRWILDFDRDVGPLMEESGVAPLPPYIKREGRPEDREDYQTVYAEHDGAIAAPTAGLHFTRDLLSRIEAADVVVRRITLHVGVGTFKPVRCADVEEHRMDAERFHVPPGTAGTLREDRRVVAVGTTAVRTLETWARTGEESGETGLFIHPPFEFKAVGALLTNFHLPKSTLLMLVSAFAGRDRILEAYEEAKREGYRFFSYGDAMFIS